MLTISKCIDNILSCFNSYESFSDNKSNILFCFYTSMIKIKFETKNIFHYFHFVDNYIVNSLDSVTKVILKKPQK